MQWFRAQFLRSPKTFFLCLFVFLLPWQTHLLLFGGTILGGDAVSPFTLIKLYATELLVVAAGIAALVVKKDRPVIDASYRVPIALACVVFVFATLSALWSVSPVLSYGMLLHLFCALLFFVLLLDKHLNLKPILLAFGVGLLAPALLGIWQYAVDTSPASTVFGLAARDASALGDAVTVASDGARQLRAYGSFSHPNVFGGYLAVGMLALVGAVTNAHEKEKRLLLGVALLLTVALVFTGSRSAILGLFLGMGLAGLVRRMRSTRHARIVVIPIAIVVIAGALLGSFFAPNLAASIRGGGATEDRAIAQRVAQYHDYFRTLDGNIFLGNGLGTYVVKAYNEHACTGWDCQPVHNVPLLIIGELGIVGALIVVSWSSSIDRINFARFPRRDATIAFAMGNVVLVILFFDHYIWSSWSGLALIAFVMALTVRMGENPSKA